MFNYIMIQTKQPINDVKHEIIDIISAMVDIKDTLMIKNTLVIIYDEPVEVLFDDFIHQLVMDMVVDMRLYEAYPFDDKALMKNHMIFINHLMKQIPFDQYKYLDDEIVTKSCMTSIKQKDYVYIFRSYAKDENMLNTIKVYLESNQNMTLAAKRLYIHRNTMIQRIDKFVEKTGFDIKKFVAGSMIYYFLTH